MTTRGAREVRGEGGCVGSKRSSAVVEGGLSPPEICGVT
jgi:hypothetical protein